jgi:hypothetical protein
MHDNFYHWHARAELKPETGILAPRWEAASKFAEKLVPSDIPPLIRLISFSNSDPEFTKRFSTALVKAEPTFPPTNNTELLRVMAAAGLVARLAKPSRVGDALALGLQAAAFPEGRAQPVSEDVLNSALRYLAEEAERVRPEIDPGALEKAEKQTATDFAALKVAAQTNSPAELGKATEAFGRGMMAALKESHTRMGEVIDRLAEETQILWWLVGRRSSQMNKLRSAVPARRYAFVAAIEVADRVGMLPPPASFESVLGEALSQCNGDPSEELLLSDLVTEADLASSSPTGTAEIAPLSSLIAEFRTNAQIDTQSLKKLGLTNKTKATPGQVSQQYFRELIFLRALEEAH